MYDLVVLGGGPGGLSVARAAAQIGAKVALIEKSKLGGECTHSACIPSKALIQAGRAAHQVRMAGMFGVRVTEPDVDFAAVMARVHRVVADFAGSGQGEGLKSRGIDVVFGSPSFEAYDTVRIDGQAPISGHRFVIATGSRPHPPMISGLEEADFLDNRTVWDLVERPESLAIIGGGASGIEFGQAFARLGVPVTILEEGPHLLPREDRELADRLRAILTTEGLSVFTNIEVRGIVVKDGRKVVKFRSKADGSTFEAARSTILVAAGRRANVEGLNLDVVGIHADPAHGIEVDDYLQTRTRSIYALGDVIGHHQFTHAAEAEAAVVFQNAVLRLSRRFDFDAVPRVVYSDPEFAAVGLSEADARARDPEARVLRADLARIARARIDGASGGLAKVVVSPAGKILGASILGPEAGLVLQEFVLALEHGLTLTEIAQTPHPFPSYAGLAQDLAHQFAVTQLERGYVRTALRWIFGFQTEPSTPSAPGSRSEEPARTH